MNGKKEAVKLFKKQPAGNYILYSLILAAGIILDQLTKFLAVKLLKPVGSVPLWEGVLHLTYVENRGAAFGMLANQRWIFIAVSTVVIIAFLYYLYSGYAGGGLQAIAVAMVTSGGIGNMIDRLALGYVVDFIDFTLIDFAVFNGADSFVCVGAGLLILALILEMVREEREKKDKGEGK